MTPSHDLLLGIDDAALAELGRLAILAARAALHGSGAPVPPPAQGALAARLGAFVSIRSAAGGVHGSVGTTAPDEPLASLVPSLARQAVLDDPREPPLDPKSEGLWLELVVVGAPSPLTDPATLRVGAEAVRIRRGLHAAVLLPSTARERAWDAETFLTFACRAAGLAGGSYRLPETEVAAFDVRELRRPLQEG